MNLIGTGAKLIRSSTDRQDTRRQHEAIDKWCQDTGVSPVHKFEDAGKRDRAEDRHDFQSMLSLIRNRALQWVVVSEFDRFGFADAFEVGGFLDTFRKNGCRLVDVTGTVWTSLDPLNVMKVFMKGLSSPEEQRSKSTRVNSQRIVSARRGEYCGGIPPYGYDVVCQRGEESRWRYVMVKAERVVTGRGKKGKITGKHAIVGEVHFPDGRVEPCDKIPPHEVRRDTLHLRPSIHPGRLDVLARMFLLMDTGHNPSSLARLFNAEGVPYYGPRWTDSIIRQLLWNPVHIGRPANGKRTHARFSRMVDGRVQSVDPDEVKRGTQQVVDPANWVMPDSPVFPPVIDPDRFARVQAMISPKKTNRPVQSDTLWLSGLLHCGRCGLPMYGCVMTQGLGKDAGRQYGTYLCSHRRKHGPDNPAGCRYHRVHHDLIEGVLSKFFGERGRTIDDLLSAERDRATLERLLVERAEHDGEMAAILRRMKSFVADNIDDALSNGLRDPDRVVCPTTMRAIRAPGVPDAVSIDSMSVVDLYDLISDHRARTLKAEIERLEGEHEAMVDRIALMTAPLAVAKLNARLGELEARIADARSQAEPLTERWVSIQQGLRHLRERIAESQVALAVGTGRMKAQAVRGAIERIELDFEARGKAASKPVRLRIIPKIGTPQEYQDKDFVACMTLQLNPSPTKTP